MIRETSPRLSIKERLIPTEYRGRSVEFEGVRIQWEKGEWKFNHKDLGVVTMPTYPLLNPEYWKEIADRLSKGETAAGMMMGVYGVFKKLNRKDAGSADDLFDKVKQRPRAQNFVALVHPNDIGFVDLDRVGEPYRRQLKKKKERLKFYAGPQHVILPVKADKVNPALVRVDDLTIASFWVPGHMGFEGLVREARHKIGRKGLLGGGSLNVHGKEPSYNKEGLYNAMTEQEEWLKEIDFVIFDDIAEAGDIARSHTMVRYLGDGSPEVIRVGSTSLSKIRMKTGHDVVVGENVKLASSKSPYTVSNNLTIDARVEAVLERIQRFEDWIKKGRR